MKKRLENFNYDMIQNVMSNTIKNKKGLFLTQEFAIINGEGASDMFRYMLSRKAPLFINDYRIGIVIKGDVRVNINLIDRHIVDGSLVFITPGSIVQPISIEGDLNIMGVAVFNDMLLPAGRIPQILKGEIRDFQLPVKYENIVWLRQLVNIIWQLVHSSSWNRDVFMSLISSMLWFYDDCYQLSVSHAVSPSHTASIFQRFIALVNSHCRTEHQLAFYADRLCVTQRHLGVVIKQVSGLTAKGWIDRALINEAKVMLKHTDMTVVQISDTLNFPNPSFFAKFFKRHANLTPVQYRLQ
ncbi:MAG: helix-turn-helix domain-containing protein [Muribaculaceae bacterium]|nr:helix-turn-helix domain-containing protein [Muribaculaceae bacterium]